jgi:hypothetical protein
MDALFWFFDAIWVRNGVQKNNADFVACDILLQFCLLFGHSVAKMALFAFFFIKPMNV